MTGRDWIRVAAITTLTLPVFGCKIQYENNMTHRVGEGTVYVCYTDQPEPSPGVNVGACRGAYAHLCNSTDERHDVSVTSRYQFAPYDEQTREFSVAANTSGRQGPFLGLSEANRNGLCTQQNFYVTMHD